MPNWCSNTLVVENLTAEEWETLYKSIKEEEFPLPFVPEPDWERTPNSDGEVPTRDDKGDLRFANGKADERWYEWRNENWGTKWKVNDASIGEESADDGTLTAGFLTAWSPLNDDCMSKVSKAFPSALFTMTYYEEGCVFIGAMLAKGGVVASMTRDFNEVRRDWEEENEETILKLKEKYKDEDECLDKLDDLWFDNRDKGIDNAFTAYKALLKIDLESRLNQREATKKRMRDAIERLKNLGPGSREKADDDTSPD